MTVTKKEKRDRALEVIERLTAVYPEALCALEYGGDPWRLLVMGRLSAQCTDKRVNEVSLELFSTFPTPGSMAYGELSEIERIVKPCGLFRMKAANIRDASRMLVEDFGGVLPDTMDELLLFPGVGRKIANLLLGDVFGKPAIVCDTHMIRICGRLGFYPERERDPTKIEYILRELIPPEAGSDLCHRIVLFGRDTCSARSPACDRCPLSDICEHKRRAK